MVGTYSPWQNDAQQKCILFCDQVGTEGRTVGLAEDKPEAGRAIGRL